VPVPERSGGTDYASYLLIDDLLALQRPPRRRACGGW
jgi:hypothetical protein